MGRFGPIPVRVSGHFGPIPFWSDCFSLGCFGPISGVGRFGLISWVGLFGPRGSKLIAASGKFAT